MRLCELLATLLLYSFLFSVVPVAKMIGLLQPYFGGHLMRCSVYTTHLMECSHFLVSVAEDLKISIFGEGM